MNRVIKLTESPNTKDEKITEYTYTSLGLLKKTIKPDGIEIINEYDSFGNKIRLCSSMGDIAYRFSYNKLDQLIEAKDEINNLVTTREYDQKGNLLEEVLSNNLMLQNEYNILNNKTKTIYPDQSYVEYDYDLINLKKISKKDSSGTTKYEHEYLKYDLSCNLLKEKFINNAGDIKYTLDKLGRTTSIVTPYHNQKITYDDIGRITNISWEKFKQDNIRYEYDDLNQIILETGLFTNSYLFDSNYNRLKKNENVYEINSLNQILNTDNAGFVYDKNGNPTTKTLNDHTIQYSYDSLDRLLKVEKKNDYALEFSYDPFNRRITKRVLRYSEGYKEEDFRYFLYDDQNEIGSFDQDLQQKELRILSDTESAEIGSAISFELEEDIYAPIYDIAGNVASLIYVNSKIYKPYLYEHYRYSAFGENKIFSYYGKTKEQSDANNPWQFSSKRIDEQSGLVYFGRRYYDPCLGRWLTCDPLGFEDGINLYCYVFNDPLTNTDLYGLYANPWMFPNNPTFNTCTSSLITGVSQVGFTSLNFFTDIGFLLSSPFLYGYQALSKTGSISESYSSLVASREFIRNSFQAKINLSADTTSTTYKYTHIAGEVVSDAYVISNIVNLGYKGALLGYRAIDTLKQLKPKNTRIGEGLDLCPTNRLYSGPNVEEFVKKVRQSITKSTINKFDFASLAKSGKVLDRGGLTKAGRALDKHGNRIGSLFPKAQGNIQSKNAQGQIMLERILKNPKSKVSVDGNRGYEIYSPDGRGAYFYKDGSFRGFIQDNN